MIRALFSEALAREASRYLTNRRIRKEREFIRETARQLCRETNRPIPPILRG